MYATAGLSGLNRFWVNQTTSPQLDFDVLLKMPFFRAVIYGAAGRLDEAFDCLDRPSRSATPHLFTWRSHPIGTACAVILDLTIA